jgi:hypothetical protein
MTSSGQVRIVSTVYRAMTSSVLLIIQRVILFRGGMTPAKTSISTLESA